VNYARVGFGSGSVKFGCGPLLG